MTNRTITLQDASGKDVVLEVLDLVQYNNEPYLILLPENGDHVYIMKAASKGEDDVEFITIDDEEILEAVYNVFVENNKDKYNFE